jgi:hypothetical protein
VGSFVVPKAHRALHVANATAQDDREKEALRMTKGCRVFLNAQFLVIPKLAEESCDFSRIQTLITSFNNCPLGKDFSTSVEMTRGERYEITRGGALE